MDLYQALILSLVEGITEFLPISSTGHLVLASNLIGLSQTNFVKSFEIFIQLGAIMGVVFLYWRTLLRDIKIWQRILVAFFPTAVVGFTLYPLIKNVLLGNLYITLGALFIGGIVLIAIELLHKEKAGSVDKISELSIKNAFIIGIFQSVSVIPGVSRAAATIIGGLLLGAKRKTATEFSFILAIPTMLAATVYDMTKSSFSFSSYEYFILLVGFVFSFFFAILAMRFLISYIEKHSFVYFGIYRIILSIIYFLVMVR